MNKQETLRILSAAGIVGMALAALGQITLHFPEGSIFYRDPENRFGSDAIVSETSIIVPDNSTASIVVKLPNLNQFVIRAIDVKDNPERLKGGIKAQVVVFGKGNTNFTKRGTKKIKGISGGTVSWK